MQANFPFVDVLEEPVTGKLAHYNYSVRDYVLGCPMRAQQYNRAACLFSGLILLCQLPQLSLAGELSLAEYGTAASLAQATPWAPSASLSNARSSKSNSMPNRHPLGIQTLSIEADWKKHADGSRLARVYQYDHSYLKTRMLLIDVDTQQLMRELDIVSPHLPLSTDEIEYAKAKLIDDTALLTSINQERAVQALEPTTDLSGYDVKASIYEPIVNDHVCSVQRCVLFALINSSLTVSSVEPLVQLGNGKVQLLQDTLP